MSSPNPTPSPLAEALANEDIAFSSPEALRALPIGSSWPGPCLPTEVPLHFSKEKRKSKLLPGEKDPQPAFRLLPTALDPSGRHSTAVEQTQPPLTETPSGVAAFFQRHDAAGLCSHSELSSVVVGPFCCHNAALAAAAEKGKQLSPAGGLTKIHSMIAANHGQCSVQSDGEDDIQPKNKEKRKERTENLIPRGLSDLEPLGRGASWPMSHSPSSRSSSGSWVTARGEDFQEADEERAKKK